MNSASAAASVASAASKATTFASQTVETARFEAIKEPLGFIKVLQFFMALLAFAIAVNGSSTLSFNVACNQPAPPAQPISSPGSTIIQADFGYPYDVVSSKFVKTSSCSGVARPLDHAGISTQSSMIVSSAQFFVFTGVVAFLYSLAFLVIYVFFKHKYDNIVFLPLIDFGATVLFAICWFASSVAWAKAINDIQYFTNPDMVIDSLPTACATKNDCTSIIYPTYANIIVSCILGFGNLILWVGDVWFVLKETSWYKTRQQLQQQQQNITNNPISTSGVTISAQFNPNNKI